MLSAAEKRVSLEKLVSDVNNSDVASVKGSLMEILRIINDPSGTASELTRFIELDPPLSGKILRRANSAYYGTRQEISEIKSAIVRLGFDEVKSLALSQKVQELFEKGEDLRDFSPSGLWKHSVAVALCGKMIYRSEFRTRGDNIYAAGLLHDLGIMIEDQFRHDSFLKIIAEKKKMRENILNAERSILGYDHMEILALLGEDWKLPKEISAAIAYHHKPGQISKTFQQMGLVLYIADYLCQREQIGFCDTPYLSHTLFRKALDQTGISKAGADLMIEQVQTEIHNMEKEGWF